MSPPYNGWGWQTTKPPLGDGTHASRASRLGPSGTRTTRAASSMAFPTLWARPGIFKGGTASDAAGIIFPMPTLGCRWNRSRLEGLVDGALSPRAERAAGRHASGCSRCGPEVERLRRLRSLVQSQTEVTDPDWSGFWPAVR